MTRDVAGGDQVALTFYSLTKFDGFELMGFEVFHKLNAAS